MRSSLVVAVKETYLVSSLQNKFSHQTELNKTSDQIHDINMLIGTSHSAAYCTSNILFRYRT